MSRRPRKEMLLAASSAVISLPSLLTVTALVRRHCVLPRGCICPSHSLLPTQLPRIAVGWVWTRFRLTKCKGISWGSRGNTSFLRKERCSRESSFVLPSPCSASCPVGIKIHDVHEGNIMVILGVTQGDRLPSATLGPPLSLIIKYQHTA